MKKFKSQIIKDLIEDGFTIDQIRYALCDGEAIEKMEWSEEEIDEAWNEIEN